jgi:hypothetical protein
VVLTAKGQMNVSVVDGGVTSGRSYGRGPSMRGGACSLYVAGGPLSGRAAVHPAQVCRPSIWTPFQAMGRPVDASCER